MNNVICDQAGSLSGLKDRHNLFCCFFFSVFLSGVCSGVLLLFMSIQYHKISHSRAAALLCWPRRINIGSHSRSGQTKFNPT